MKNIARLYRRLFEQAASSDDVASERAAEKVIAAVEVDACLSDDEAAALAHAFGDTLRQLRAN